MLAIILAALAITAAILLLRGAKASADGRKPVLPSTERSTRVEPATLQEGTAAHEAGHAILAWVSPFVSEVTHIVLEEGGGGVTSVRRGEITSSARLWDVIAISLAGIAAEGYAFGRVRGSECRRDLRCARKWAERLVRENADALATFPWMDPASRSTLDIGRMFAERPDEAVCEVMNLAYRHAKDVIALRPDAFLALTAAAREKKQLTHRDIEPLLGPRPWAVIQ